MNLDRQPLGAADPEAAATGRAAAGQEPHMHADQSNLLVCPSCKKPDEMWVEVPVEGAGWQAATVNSDGEITTSGPVEDIQWDRGRVYPFDTGGCSCGWEGRLHECIAAAPEAKPEPPKPIPGQETMPV